MYSDKVVPSKAALLDCVQEYFSGSLISSSPWRKFTAAPVPLFPSLVSSAYLDRKLFASALCLLTARTNGPSNTDPGTDPPLLVIIVT